MNCCGGKESAATDTSKPPPPQVAVLLPSSPSTNAANSSSRPRDFNNDKVEKYLRNEKRNEDNKYKLLLLGTGESGKSTIFKQFRIIYGTQKSDDDLRMYGVVVRSNAITAITKLCELVRDLGFEDRLIQESNIANDGVPEDGCGMTVKDAYDQIMIHLVDNNASRPLSNISPERMENDWVQYSPRAGIKANSDAIQCLQLADAIEVLWQSPTIQVAWMKRAQKNIIDSHASFLKDVKRIASSSYIPTNDDVLKARLRTTQVILERFTIDGTEIEVCDVGGQRSERRKWINCFTDVNAVIFVAALSEYDQKLAETKTQNRMVEALNLFGSIVKNAYFEKKPIMLFLNKKDIFAEKIQFSDIQKVPHFSDYGGPRKDFDYGVLYFIQKFEEQTGEEFQDNFIHVTNATDTSNMEFVLHASKMIIMQNNFAKAFRM